MISKCKYILINQYQVSEMWCTSLQLFLFNLAPFFKHTITSTFFVRSCKFNLSFLLIASLPNLATFSLVKSCTSFIKKIHCPNSQFLGSISNLFLAHIFKIIQISFGLNSSVNIHHQSKTKTKYGCFILKKILSS